MKTGRVRRLRCDETQAAHQLRSGRDADEQPIAAESFALARGEQCRNDHGARMHGSTLERVIEVFTVRRRPIDERGAERVESSCMADGRARSATIDARQRRRDVIGAPRRDAESRHVEKQPPHCFARSGRHVRRFRGREPCTEFFSEHGHGAWPGA